MNGTPLALGVAAGLVLASALTKKPAGSRDRGIDHARIRELGEKLRAYTRGIIDEAGDDLNNFDPYDYDISKGDMEHVLGVPVLGWGLSRVVVRVAPGIVAKLPWREDGVERNAAEVSLYDEASDEVKEMLLPPLDYVYPPGAAVFPEVEVVAASSREQAALPQRKRQDLEHARARWLALVRSGEPGAVTGDVHSGENWGILDGKMVLIDYEPEGNFNRTGKKRRNKR